MTVQPIENDNADEGTIEQINFVYHEWIMKTETSKQKKYDTPSSINEALSPQWAEQWTPSIASEIMNFIKRNSWKLVP